MSTPALLAIIVAPFVILGILLFVVTRANIWKPDMLETGEQILYREGGVNLNIISSPSTIKNLNLIFTNKRIFLLRGKYRFMTIYFDPTQYQEVGGKIKKSFSTNRYNVFTSAKDFHISTGETGHLIRFGAKTFMGLEGQYEILVHDATAFENFFSK